MKHFKAIILSIALVLGAGGLATAFTATPAFASGSGEQFCGVSGTTWFCLNAWGGGPSVNVYTGGPNTSNNDFTAYRTPQGHIELEFTGGGGDTGLCIGDYGNNPNNARTGLVECPTSGAGGWGTQLQLQTAQGCVANTVVIYDYHDNAYIGAPNGFQNGSPFYLNTQSSQCFYTYNPS